jgi:hypothetical protein
MSHEVRVGDRYVHGDSKITITGVEVAKYGDRYARYSVLHDNGTTWAGRCEIPVPERWVKAGSGPKVVVLCLLCETEDTEPGMDFCLDCADKLTEQWAGLDAEEIKDRVVALHLAREIDERDDANRERTRERSA